LYMARRPKKQRHIPIVSHAQVLGIILLIVALITLLSLLSFRRGALTSGWLRLLRRAFGWGIYVTPPALGAGGLWLLLRSMGLSATVAWERLAGAVALIILLLALSHLLMPAAERQTVAHEGGGGGYLGWAIGRLLVSGVGQWGSYVVLLALSGATICLLFSLSPREIGKALRWMGELVRHRRMARRELTIERGMDSAAKELTIASPVAPTGTLFPYPGALGGEGQWKLPAIADILTLAPEPEVSEAEIRRRARIIEETLAQFGLPARVVEVNQGPVITQFGLQLGYITRRSGEQQRVKVSQINSLANDLALALSASPVRIEAPIPGRPLVGIEVPNAQSSLVCLRGVMESEEFQRLASPLRIALGRDVSGWPVVADLAAMPHLLIAGATGSGKSVCINAIISCLLCNNTPDRLKLVMVDPKMVELTVYNGIPHLLAPVVVEAERAVETLEWVTRQMDDRYRRFAGIGARNLEEYNQRAASRAEKELPYILVVIDELADLMMIAPDEAERLVCRLAQMARATGIHLIVATQRPSVDVVTGLIKANFPARIAFATASQVDSRVVLDSGGAEQLLGRGDMLYMAPDSSRLVRIQGCLVSEGELRALTRYWRQTRIPSTSPDEPVQPPLWTPTETGEAQEELLEQAIKLVCQKKHASATFLQRRLRVALPCAARLIQLMEERGIIAPSGEVLVEGEEHLRGSP